jgi:glycosyltransferase involved in cell wall biosynthesis
MISVVIPSYKNPEYLELCIESLMRHQVEKNEIVVVLDGFREMYNIVMNNYPTQVKWLWLDENQGLPMATNVGVYNATSDRILIINEDNVAPMGWDRTLNKVYEPNTVYAVQQVEPTPSIFNFLHADFGKTPRDFDLEGFVKYASSHEEYKLTDDSYTLPIFMSKKWYMAVNGWDTAFISPFVVDLDFFLKLQLVWSLEFRRTHGTAFYHFGSRSTKRREDGEQRNWTEGEQQAAMQFQYKWGIYPQRMHNNRVNMQGLRGV